MWSQLLHGSKDSSEKVKVPTVLNNTISIHLSI